MNDVNSIHPFSFIWLEDYRLHQLSVKFCRLKTKRRIFRFPNAIMTITDMHSFLPIDMWIDHYNPVGMEIAARLDAGYYVVNKYRPTRVPASPPVLAAEQAERIVLTW